MEGYVVSKSVLERFSQEEIEQMCLESGSVDFGWWTRFPELYRGGVTEEDVQRIFETEIELLEKEWESPDEGIRRADLLSRYANAYYQGTRDLLDSFLRQKLPYDTEVLPILFLFCQFCELAIKACFEHIAFIKGELGKPVELPAKLYDNHDLKNLLVDLKLLFTPDEPFLSQETQEFIVKIQEINDRSQAFRYPFTIRKGKKVFLVKSSPLHMRLFKAEFDIHADELLGFMDYLLEGYIYFQQKDESS